MWSVQRIPGAQLLGPPIRSVTNGPHVATSVGRFSLLVFFCFGSIVRPVVYQASEPKTIATQENEASINGKYKQARNQQYCSSPFLEIGRISQFHIVYNYNSLWKTCVCVFFHMLIKYAELLDTVKLNVQA